MALTKEDLGQIKDVVKEVLDPMGAEIKKEIEDLAIMTKKGFDSVDEQFKGVDEQFDSVDEQFKKVDEQFKGVDEQFKKVDEHFDKIDDKLDDLGRSNTQAHEDMALRLDNVAYRFELVDLKKRVDVLENRARIHA